MTNITLAIDDELLASVRAFARANGTTLNALVRRELRQLVDADGRQEEARRRLIELAEESTADMGKGFKFNRDEMYDARLSGHKRAPLRRRRKAS
jgi:hypothetical protein